MEQFFIALTQIGIFLILICVGIMTVKIKIFNAHSLEAVSKLVIQISLPLVITLLRNNDDNDSLPYNIANGFSVYFIVGIKKCIDYLIYNDTTSKIMLQYYFIKVFYKMRRR